MNIEISIEQRIAFREWLREELRKRDFYQRRGDCYLIREFSRECERLGHPINEASLGRYINREDDPVVPTPITCRDLAAVLGIPAIDVMKAAGLVREEDWHDPAAADAGEDDTEREEKGA